MIYHRVLVYHRVQCPGLGLVAWRCWEGGCLGESRAREGEGQDQGKGQEG